MSDIMGDWCGTGSAVRRAPRRSTTSLARAELPGDERLPDDGSVLVAFGSAQSMTASAVDVAERLPARLLGQTPRVDRVGR
jgi:hypothetical protein